MLTGFRGIQLENESDVEQKVAWPLLTSALPYCLGHPEGNVKTKSDIRAFPIGKGRTRRSHFPDYLVQYWGLPLLIVETKAPSESLEEAFREARMYAAEVNGRFPKKINPCEWVMALNGRDLWLGHWDCGDPELRLDVSSLDAGDGSAAKLIQLVGRKSIEDSARVHLESLIPNAHFRPLSLLGGQAVQNEEVGYNSFAATLALNYRHLFNPTTPEERAFIAKNAYVGSRRRDAYIKPIDQIIRAANPPSVTDSTPVQDTAVPREIVEALRTPHSLAHRTLLLIGGVGVGKSTFVEYLKVKALPTDLRGRTVWAHLNMNNAPMSRDLIYDWTLRGVISALKETRPDIDFDDLDAISDLYGPEIDRLKKGPLSLVIENSQEYLSQLSQQIMRFQADLNLTAFALERTICSRNQRLLIVVLDNCDKRVRDEQLLLFELAQWLQTEMRCLVFLPIRDVTYDQHRQEPPLDTALKDLVFRIDPPSFVQVLYRRILLALEDVTKQDRKGKRRKVKKLSFELPGGVRVDYPASDQGVYLASILQSVFRYDHIVRQIIVGLAGRDIRRALEIFLHFCTSGHIGEDVLFAMRQRQGNFRLPFGVAMAVLLRGNRRYYDGDVCALKNIFQCSRTDERPDHFLRFRMLLDLHQASQRRVYGGRSGYVRAGDILARQVDLGCSLAQAHRELLYLLRSDCVLAEHLRSDEIGHDDLITLAPAGLVHLELVGNWHYVGACAEDTWIRRRDVAEDIASGLRSGDPSSLSVAQSNAASLLDYLVEDLNQQSILFPSVLQENSSQALSKRLDVVRQRLEVNMARGRERDPWFGLSRRLKVGTTREGRVTGIVEYGCFVEVEAGVIGLVHRSRIPSELTREQWPVRGARVMVRVENVNESSRRLALALEPQTPRKRRALRRNGGPS